MTLAVALPRKSAAEAKRFSKRIVLETYSEDGKVIPAVTLTLLRDEADAIPFKKLPTEPARALKFLAKYVTGLRDPNLKESMLLRAVELPEGPELTYVSRVMHRLFGYASGTGLRNTDRWMTNLGTPAVIQLKDT